MHAYIQSYNFFFEKKLYMLTKDSYILVNCLFILSSVEIEKKFFLLKSVTLIDK